MLCTIKEILVSGQTQIHPDLNSLTFEQGSLQCVTDASPFRLEWCLTSLRTTGVTLVFKFYLRCQLTLYLYLRPSQNTPFKGIPSKSSQQQNKLALTERELLRIYADGMKNRRNAEQLTLLQKNFQVTE